MYNNRYDIEGCRNTAREANIQFFPKYDTWFFCFVYIQDITFDDG